MDALVNEVESTENVVDASHFYNGEVQVVIVDSTELSEAETPNQPNPTTYKPSSRNGILIEFQNTMSVPAYDERVPIETHLFTAIFRFFYRPH